MCQLAFRQLLTAHACHSGIPSCMRLFALVLDFSNIHFLEDWSLCTIFGNLIDNAIEACQRISDPKQRWICVRGGITAGFLQITFKNT